MARLMDKRVIHPFVISTLLTILAFLSLQFVDPLTEERGDALILGGAMVAAAFVAAIMLLWTRWMAWTWFGAGLYWTFVGIAVLFAYVFIGIVSDGDRSPYWLEVSRSTISVGAGITLIGIILRLTGRDQGQV